MQNIDRVKNVLFCCCTLLLSLLASYQLYQATIWGAGLSPDSVNYLGGARNILETWSLKGIGSHWPPLYFILIALSELIIGDTLAALRWLQIVTMVLNCVIFSYIIWKATYKALIPTLVGSLLFVTSQSVLFIHTMAWSEASFFLFAMLGFHFLASYLEHNNKLSVLTLSSLFIGLAFITRYVGITLIITGLITLLLYTNGDRKKQITNSLYFAFISSLPMLLWMGRNLLFSKEATIRQFVAHPVSMEKVQAGIQVLLNWLYIPANYPFLLLVVLALITALYIISIKQATITHLDRTPEICFIFIFTYIPFLLFSISFFDAHTPLDTRILFPVYIFFMLGVVLLNHRVSYAKSIKYVSYLILLLMLLLIFAQDKAQKRFISNATWNGIGFASKQWVQSDTLQWVKKLPMNTIIYTNAPDPINIHTGRASKMIPRHSDPGNRKKNKNIMHEIKTMASELSENKGVIIYFNTITWRWYLPTISQLNQVLPLQFVYIGKDGIVVRLAELP